MKKDKRAYQKPKIKSSKIERISFYSKSSSRGFTEEGLLLAATPI